MSDIFPFPSSPEPPKEVQVANGLLLGINQELQRRVQLHIQNFDYLWNRGDGEPTADQIVSAMGTNAVKFFALASLSADQIDEAAKLVGKTIDDFIPAEKYVPPATVQPNADGTVTLIWPEPPPPPDPVDPSGV